VIYVILFPQYALHPCSTMTPRTRELWNDGALARYIADKTKGDEDIQQRIWSELTMMSIHDETDPIDMADMILEDYQESVPSD